ncbi:Cytokinin-O-glucosyltransferase 2 [Hordeum vulgare]|nr:Cytokinin-O-glucosyltransferase 2 [Hordeum vulgare]
MCLMARGNNEVSSSLCNNDDICDEDDDDDLTENIHVISKHLHKAKNNALQRFQDVLAYFENCNDLLNHEQAKSEQLEHELEKSHQACRDLRSSKGEIEVAHDKLKKDFEFRTLCNTPYAEVIGPEVDREAATGQGAGAEATNGQGSQNEVPEAQENVEVLPNLSSSFDDWLQQPFPSMDDLKVPAQFQTLYDKHKENFSTEVDDAIRKFGQSLQRLQSSRMASMLRDVGDAIANTTDEAVEKAKDAQDEAATPTMDEAREKEKDAQDEAEAATPPMDEAREKEKDAQAATSCIGDQAEGTVAVMSKDEVVGEMEKNQEVAEDAGQTHQQQRVSMEVEVHVPPQSPPPFHDAPRSATAGVWDDESSCELFPKGSEDFNLMHGMDEPTNNNKTCSNIYPNIPVFPVSDDDGSPTIPAQTMGVTDEQPIDVGSGPSTHDKNTRKKRMAKVPVVKPKGKKQKVEVKEDKVKAIYEKYITHGKPLRRSKPNELPTPFIKIGGFYVGYKKFLACLKPRGDMNDEVMSLCIERLNMASYATHNRAVKNTSSQSTGQAVTKFKVQKYDLLWFAVVHECHWIVVCANLLHKQWNAFDSISAKGKPLTLKKQANNLITNFTTLTQECDAFNVNVASFTRADLEDYPKQNNLCDCGFFAVKYAENFDGKAMKGFEQEDIARYRMEWVYNLIHHSLNTASMELAFREELAD